VKRARHRRIYGFVGWKEKGRRYVRVRIAEIVGLERLKGRGRSRAKLDTKSARTGRKNRKKKNRLLLGRREIRRRVAGQPGPPGALRTRFGSGVLAGIIRAWRAKKSETENKRYRTKRARLVVRNALPTVPPYY